jgi:hypothetical protein
MRWGITCREIGKVIHQFSERVNLSVRRIYTKWFHIQGERQAPCLPRLQCDSLSGPGGCRDRPALHGCDVRQCGEPKP